jgi:hypothetical protein
MAAELESLVRVAVLATLKNDAGLLALVAASSIDPDPEREPTWPFVTTENYRNQPFEQTCVRGGLVTGDLHGFAGPRKNGNQVVEYARDHAGRIGGALQRALHRNRLDIEGGGKARIRLSDIRLMADGSPQAFHWFAQINAKVLAE